jgi:tetratricopeptide (TPR) repeat protein
VKEAIAQQRVALELDPLSPVLNTTLGVSLAAIGEFEESRIQYERTLADGGEQSTAHAALFLWGPQMGVPREEMAEHAVGFARAMGAADPEVARVLGYAIANDRADDALRTEAREAISALIADSVFTVRQIASVYTGLGDDEMALDWLERASEGDLSLGLVGIDPALDPLRSNPRMQALMDQLGLPNGYDPAADTYEAEGAP